MKGEEGAKFKEVLHYIVNSVGGRPNVGKTVLFKLMYFSDFDYYERYEEKLTGENYRKIPMGPAPCSFDQAVQELITEGKIENIQQEHYRYTQEKYLALEEPELNLLSAKEIKLIDEVIEKYGGHGATEISQISHEDMPWKASDDNEIIDYELVFYRNPSLSARNYDEE